MDITFATTIAYLASGSLVLLAAALLLRKELKNTAGSFVFAGVGLLAVVVVALPVHQFGVQGVLDMTAAWQHTMPIVGWLLIGSFVVGIATPVPCVVHAFGLARNSIAEHRLHARVTARLNRLRRDI